jgi:hypothetical protein
MGLHISKELLQKLCEEWDKGVGQDRHGVDAYTNILGGTLVVTTPGEETQVIEALDLEQKDLPGTTE